VARHGERGKPQQDRGRRNSSFGRHFFLLSNRKLARRLFKLGHYRPAAENIDVRFCQVPAHARGEYFPVFYSRPWLSGRGSRTGLDLGERCCPAIEATRFAQPVFQGLTARIRQPLRHREADSLGGLVSQPQGFGFGSPIEGKRQREVGRRARGKAGRRSASTNRAAPSP
jgi:hypothetical protein